MNDNSKCTIYQCVQTEPFAFVSYSSEDAEYVHKVVAQLQYDGYNIWIDEPNLDKSKESWEQDALKAIKDIRCNVVLFFVSKNSLTSLACLSEVEYTSSPDAQITHLNQSVPLILVEVDPIDNLVTFRKNLHQTVLASPRFSKQKQEACITTLGKFGMLFPDNNRVRIRSAAHPGRNFDILVVDIAKQIESHEVKVNEKVAATLMLDNICVGRMLEARNIASTLIARFPASTKIAAKASNYYQLIQPHRALAWYLANALLNDKQSAYISASKCCFLLGEIDKGMKCLEISAHDDAKKFLITLQALTPELRTDSINHMRNIYYGS